MGSLPKNSFIEEFNELHEILLGLCERREEIEEVKELLREHKKISELLFNAIKADLFLLINLLGDNPISKALFEKWNFEI